MTRLWLAAACVAALAMAAAEVSGLARAADDRGVLAVVRRDGLLIPFAAYKGSSWSSPWPAGTSGIDLPVNLDAVPGKWWGGERPAGWVLHLLDGSTRSIALLAPRVFLAFCRTRIGIQTDYRPAEPLPPTPADPFPKDGLAVSGGTSVLPIESVDPHSPEAANLLRSLTSEIDKAESSTIGAIHGHDGWTHPFDVKARQFRPVVMEAWYRAPMDDPAWVASYVEAVRSYPPRPEDKGCGLETFVSGWVHQNVKDPSKNRAQLAARVTYCDRVGVKYMLPFGRIHGGDRQYWVYQLSGFEGEWYEVVRIEPLRIRFVVEAFGGTLQGSDRTPAGACMPPGAGTGGRR
jgi:hypothetical protein